MAKYIVRFNSVTVLNDQGEPVAKFSVDPYKDVNDHYCGWVGAIAPDMIAHQNYNYHGTTDIDSKPFTT